MKAIVFEGKVIGCHESAEIDGNQVLTDAQTYAGFEDGQVILVDVSTDMTGMSYADGVFSQPAPEAHATPRRITPEAYFRRFTVFEEAARALFAGERERFEALVAAWPADVAAHAGELAAPSWRVPAIIAGSEAMRSAMLQPSIVRRPDRTWGMLAPSGKTAACTRPSSRSGIICGAPL